MTFQQFEVIFEHLRVIMNAVALTMIGEHAHGCLKPIPSF
jgi:hypothetical protein